MSKSSRPFEGGTYDRRVAAADTSVLFLAPEPLGATETGPARRTVKLAEAVAEHCSVTLAAPGPSRFPEGPFRVLETGPPDDGGLGAALAGHDVAVVQTLPSPRQLLTVRRNVRHLVVDLLAPLALEAAEIGPAGPARGALARWRVRELLAHLALADLVLCTNERQCDLAIGAALASGQLGGDGARPSLADRIAVVPHGIDAAPPLRTRAPLRGAGLVGDGDRLAIWAGGMWSWLDPLTAIRAVERLRPRRPDLKLALVGFEHPDLADRRAHGPVAEEAARYVRERELGETVVFRPRWLEREDYFDHLREADVAVSLHRPTLEGRFATRTRVLDYLAAGLPVVCTGGDTMADLVASHGLGQVVDPLDADGCAAALDHLTNGSGGEQAWDRSALERFEWRNVARPLVDFCLEPGPAQKLSRAGALRLALHQYPAFTHALYRTDKAGMLRAAGRTAARALRR